MKRKGVEGVEAGRRIWEKDVVFEYHCIVLHLH